jgi:hypothetical protein
MAPPVNGNRPVLSRRGFRLTAFIAAGVCVLAIAAGAFAFSYPGVRDTALTAGVSPRLAKFYPLLFDAVLIVACAAAITLRGVLRGFAWLAVLVIIGAIATADTAHALSITVPKRPLEATIAIAPWVALLTGLTLLDAMIRRAPGRRTGTADPASANGQAPAAGSPDSTAEQPASAVVVPLSALMQDPLTAPASRARAAASQDWTAASQDGAAASQDGAAADQPAAAASQDGAAADQPAAAASRGWVTAADPAAGAGQPEAAAGPPQTTAGPAAAEPDEPAVAGSPATVPQTPPTPRPPEPEAPGDDAHAGSADPVTHFDRMRSTPAPPKG